MGLTSKYQHLYACCLHSLFLCCVCVCANICVFVCRRVVCVSVCGRVDVQSLGNVGACL